jgi:hypothetical protein
VTCHGTSETAALQDISAVLGGHKPLEHMRFGEPHSLQQRTRKTASTACFHSALSGCLPERMEALSTQFEYCSHFCSQLV